MLRIVEYAATLGTILGFYIVSEGCTFGFYISLLSNILWIVWGYRTSSRGIVLVNLFLGAAAINGILG